MPLKQSMVPRHLVQPPSSTFMILKMVFLDIFEGP